MSSVKLYVYDLSNGLARQMSQQLTGRQIDGIWHTSVVVFGKEIFYGQGIDITLPGRSHHGQPHQQFDLGETALDEDTFNEYLAEMREHYTADKYHLLDFNCNSFTNDCVGFLTGGEIPGFIKGPDLPTDFLATPFGAALRPTIDGMYRRPAAGRTPGPVAPPVANTDNIASALLQAVASRAASNGQLPTPNPTSPSTPTPNAATQTLTSPIHVSTNPASFSSVLHAHRAVVAFFTSTTCGPCRMIAPVFEELARAKARGGNGVAFVKVDLDVGLGSGVAGEWGVKVTPTFLFFMDGKKINELKGVNAPELRTLVDLLLFQVFPPHPHVALSLPTVEHISLNPILFSQVPALDSVNAKLCAFIDGVSAWPPSVAQSQSQVKQTLSHAVLPFLKVAASASKPKASAGLLVPWARVTATLSDALQPAELFPLVDMWRLAIVDPSVSSWCAAAALSANTNKNAPDPISIFLAKATAALAAPGTVPPRNFMLIILRLLANTFSNTALARILLAEGTRVAVTDLLVTSLLHADAAVRTAAASLAFNIAAYFQKRRVDQLKGQDSGGGGEEAGEWEVEIVSAVIEAIDRERASEEVVHRLTACLACFVRFSPFYDDQLAPLLEVLQSQTILKSKLNKTGFGESGLQKQDVRKLVQEVATKLCP
ncbi:DUF862-domain-containing protein [Athelia psychrophila]|uniref:DUF862-domain-containing protein n=1 Tax=Athelia psychrophila TaxID=1759441 RepID=A0A166W6E2_9AGAM|nr:DUF862-domain-containing protein [Fibularhizoctonia sp. CBS 109695]